MSHADRIQELDRQARWKLRAEQGAERPRKSTWVITSLQSYLPPDQVGLAQRLAYLQATIEGCRVMDAKVDGLGNKAEIAMAARMDALQELTGYEAAARARVGSDAALCVRAIAESENMTVTARRCGYPVGSHRSLRRLVQLTLEALSAYRDECEADAARWNGRAA